MRKATRITAALLGLFAGFGGPEHGYFEILQGNVKPDGLFIASIGPPCDPQAVWNLCEPALTVVPSFLVTGILAFIIGTVTMIWSAAFVQRRNGGLMLILLSVALLLFGGGLFPPVIGVVAGVMALKVNAPITKKPGRVSDLLSRLWPWSLVFFYVWAFGQFAIGHFFNDWLKDTAMLVPLLILGLLILSIVSAHVHDLRAQANANEGGPMTSGTPSS